jgi:hypothetical protein
VPPAAWLTRRVRYVPTRASARIVWGTVALIVLTAALVALTVILAVRS